MLTELQENLEAILTEKNTKIIPGNIKSGVTIFNVTGEAPSIPDGVFIQTTTPTKTTEQAIWLQESTITTSSFIGNIPNAVLQWSSSANKTVAEFILDLNATIQTNIDSYKQHLLFINGDTIYLVASDTLYYDPSNNATVTFNSTERVFVTYTSSGVVDYTSDSSITTTQMLTANNKYTDKNIYSTDGTKVTVKAYIDSTNYLSIEVDNKKYEVQVNKGSQFNKILDTADGDATTGDLASGKIAYVNNTKIVGTNTWTDAAAGGTISELESLADDILGVS